MGDKIPIGGSADYFEVSLGDTATDFRTCGHAHESIESAVQCLQKIPGGSSIVAFWKRRDAIGSERLYDNGVEYLTDFQVQALLRWHKRTGGN